MPKIGFGYFLSLPSHWPRIHHLLATSILFQFFFSIVFFGCADWWPKVTYCLLLRSGNNVSSKTLLWKKKLHTIQQTIQQTDKTDKQENQQANDQQIECMPTRHKPTKRLFHLASSQSIIELQIKFTRRKIESIITCTWIFSSVRSNIVQLVGIV